MEYYRTNTILDFQKYASNIELIKTGNKSDKKEGILHNEGVLH